MSAQPTFDPEARRRRLAGRHLLRPATRATGLAEIVDAVVGLHSSDPVSVYLSAGARLRDATVATIEAALYEERVAVRHHAMRRTLWVFAPAVARLAHASASRGLVAPHRRQLAALLVDNGVTTDPERWIDEAIAATAAALHSRGEATTRELGEAVPTLRAPLAIAPGKPYGTTVAAHTRVLTLMGFAGEIVRTRPVGSWVSGQYRWAVAGDWFDGGFGDDDPAAAAADLVAHYLRSFGPVSVADVQWWTGWTKRATVAALDRAGAVEVTDGDGRPLLVDADDPALAGTEPDGGPDGAEPWVALLPGLDPTVMGWKERDWYLDPAVAAQVFDRNGNAGPTIWADGRVIGAWVQRPDGELAWRTLEPLSAEHRRLLGAELDRVAAFLGDTRCTVRFPSPLSRELTS